MKRVFILILFFCWVVAYCDVYTVNSSHNSESAGLNIFKGAGHYVITYNGSSMVAPSIPGVDFRTHNFVFLRLDGSEYLVGNYNPWEGFFASSTFYNPLEIDINSTATAHCAYNASDASQYVSGSVSFSVAYTPSGSPPVITSAISLSKTGGQSFSYTITATGDPTIVFTVSDLPAYLSFDGVNKVTGTLPYSSTPYNCGFNVTATNSVGSDNETVLINVAAAGAPVWADPITNNYDVGYSFSKNLVGVWVTGAPTIVVAVQGSLPSFLTLNNNVLSGTCSTPGVFTFVLSATNDYGIVSKTITFNIAGSSPIYVGPIPPVLELTKGVAFNINLSNVWDNDNSVTVSGLPSWASVSNSILSGTVPAEETRQNITGMMMTASNDVGNSTHALEFNILGNNDFYFTSPSTGQGVIGQSFSYTATTNLSFGVSYSMSNAPSWLSCTSSGSITGTVPEGITGFSFTVFATHYEFGTISMTVQCSAVTSDGGGGGAPQHVIVDNFSDFGGIQWAGDMKGLLSNVSQSLSDMKINIQTLASRQEITNDKLESISVGLGALGSGLQQIDSDINSGFNGVNSNLQQINSDMNTGISGLQDSFDHLNNVVDTFGLDLDNIYTEQQAQTEILEDIRDSLDVLSSVPEDLPDMSVDYTPPEIHSASVDVSFFQNYLNKNYSKVPPSVTMPLSMLYPTIPDYTFDFSRPEVYNAIQYLRMIETGCVFICCLVLIFKTIRTFEF